MSNNTDKLLISDLDHLRILYEKIIGSSAKKCDSIIDYADNIYDYFNNIIFNTPGSVYWKDLNGIYLGCNRGALDLVGFSNSDEFIGKTDYDFARILNWQSGVADSLREADNQVIITKKPIYNIEEGLLITGGNSTIYQLSSKVPLFNREHQITGILGISIDITERKLAEAREVEAVKQTVLAQAKAKSEEELRQAVMILTGSIVHDLRNMITTLSLIASKSKSYFPAILAGYRKAKESNLLVSPIKEDEAEAFVFIDSTLSRIAKNMNEFIDSTLQTISNALIGDVDRKDLMPCSIDYCLDQTFSYYEFTDRESLLINWKRGDDFRLLGNAILMIRVLSNLLKNALYQIRLNRKGAIFVTTEIGTSFNTLHFRDTAGGAPPEVVEHIFDGFYTTKSQKGTGVGLAFCKKCMQDLGGDIICESVYGDYMDFILTFPVKKIEMIQ